MTRRRNILTAATLAMAATWSPWAAVLSARTHDAKGPNGGQLTDAGKYHVELVGKGTRLEVFVSDANEKPLPATALAKRAPSTCSARPCRLQTSPMAPSSSGR